MGPSWLTAPIEAETCAPMQAGRHLAQQFVPIGEAVVEDTLLHAGFRADRPGGGGRVTVADQNAPGGLQQQFPPLGCGNSRHRTSMPRRSPGILPGDAAAGKRRRHSPGADEDSGRAAGGEAARPLSFTTVTGQRSLVKSIRATTWSRYQVGYQLLGRTIDEGAADSDSEREWANSALHARASPPPSSRRASGSPSC